MRNPKPTVLDRNLTTKSYCGSTNTEPGAVATGKEMR